MISLISVTEALQSITAALTPDERWKAARSFDTSFMTEWWFTITGIVAIAVLIVLLLVVTYRRRKAERQAADRLFLDCAEKRGLSEYERWLLREVVAKSGLKQIGTIFTTSDAFDRGTRRLIEQGLTADRPAGAGKQLKTELSSLREKLGFLAGSSASSARLRRVSSRQIPVGKTLQITRHKARDAAALETTVIKSDDMELAVKLAEPLESGPGDCWLARYYFGSSVWEFDTSVISCYGDVLVLNHTDNVRFINRRRFLRVPVRKPAYIAHFPFSRTVPTVTGSRKAGYKSDTTEHRWGPPQFVPATLMELAGPGLRVEVPLQVKVGDRVLVVFELDGRDSRSSRRSQRTECKIVEDIGEVRHTRTADNGFSIAIELTGLSDSDISELIRATNAASAKTDTEKRDVTRRENENRKIEQQAAEPVGAKGA